MFGIRRKDDKGCGAGWKGLESGPLNEINIWIAEAQGRYTRLTCCASRS